MMTQKQAIKKYNQLNSKLIKCQEELLNFQKNICPHHNLIYENHGSGGNWDQVEVYWRIWECKDCNYRFTTTQDFEIIEKMKIKYPNARKIK